MQSRTRDCMTHPQNSIPEPIAQLQEQLTQFRNSNQPRTRLPESFWQAAVELARQYGIYQTAHPLRLDYMGLKKRLLTRAAHNRSEPKTSPARLRGADGATEDERRVPDRVRIRAEARCAFIGRPAASARLDEPAARLAGNRGMIQITAQMRVLVAIEPVDGRKGIDSLARLCQEKLAEDPFSGCVFVFRSRSGTAIRLLTYDGQGYWLAQKRLSKGRFAGGRRRASRPNRWRPTRRSC